VPFLGKHVTLCATNSGFSLQIINFVHGTTAGISLLKYMKCQLEKSAKFKLSRTSHEAQYILRASPSTKINLYKAKTDARGLQFLYIFL
jgi:hypothetical protein